MFTKLFNHFLFMLDPHPYAKKNPTRDPAFRWYRMLGMVLLFSPTNCCVCPEKVFKMALFWCSEPQWTKFTCKLLLELKRYQSKDKVF